MVYAWSVEEINKHQNYILKILLYLQESSEDNTLLKSRYRDFFDQYISLFEHGKTYEEKYDLPRFYQRDSDIITIYTINKKNTSLSLREEKKKTSYDRKTGELGFVNKSGMTRYS